MRVKSFLQIMHGIIEIFQYFCYEKFERSNSSNVQYQRLTIQWDTLCMRVLIPLSACPFFSRYRILHTGCCADRYATCSEQTANGRTDGRRSLLAPRFPLVCPRIILFAATAAPRTSTVDDEAIKPSRPRLLTLIRASDAAKASRKASELSRCVCEFKHSQDI